MGWTNEGPLLQSRLTVVVIMRWHGSQGTCPVCMRRCLAARPAAYRRLSAGLFPHI